MLITKLLKLPSLITYQGVTFHLIIFNESYGEARLCYQIYDVSDKSKHRKLYNRTGAWANPFAQKRIQGFLFLFEGIGNDLDMNMAIDTCMKFLKKHKLLKK